MNAEMKSNDAIGIYWNYCLEMSEVHRADGISRSDFTVSAESTRYGCTELRMWDMVVLDQLVNNLLMYANCWISAGYWLRRVRSCHARPIHKPR
jgi:hypothetical protein